MADHPPESSIGLKLRAGYNYARMALISGTKLGPYEIAAPLGAGGMGEVYRARDTRLGREVAIKVLAEPFPSPQHKERFQREAKVLSSLSHPNVCALYDVGQYQGSDFLVLEFLEGESLADRLVRGPLSARQVLEHGAQVAEALAAAHRAGLVHRDLKPGNIMLTKLGVKLLDFGLAKSASAPIPPDSLTASKPLTAEGTIVGTYQYMAPEQVEGEEADSRTDIFALGTVMYEMATGRRAFEGKSRVTVMSAILEKDPEPMASIQPLTPPALEHVVRLCLAKEPDQRWQSASDLARELKWIAESGSSTLTAQPMARKKHLPVQLLAVGLLLVVGGALAGYFLRAPKPPPPVWSNLNLGGDLGPEGSFALSPDGQKLAYVATTPDGKFLLWVRSLDSPKAQPLDGTEGAALPFWSTDSRSIGFFTGSKLDRIEATGQGLQTICDAPNGRGGTWNSDGVIVLAPDGQGNLARVSASGGTLVEITKRKATPESHRWPYFLPDGRHFLFTQAYTTTGEDGIYVATLDHSETKLVLAGSLTNAAYSAGYLLFVRDGKLMTMPFDTGHLRTRGEAVLLGDSVRWVFDRRLADFSVAANGELAFLPATNVGQRLVWFNRSGKQLGVALPDIGQPTSGVASGTLSQDGTRVSLTRVRANASDIWSYDLKTGIGTRLTFADNFNEVPLWSSDGKSIVYTGNMLDHYELRLKALSGTGEEQVLLSDPTNIVSTSWSRDGRYLSYIANIFGPSGKTQVWALALQGGHKPFQAVQSTGNAADGYFSPDGKWLAYDSDETGRSEVYATSFPGHNGKWQISSNGGLLPTWVGNGNQSEVLFVDQQSRLVSVPVTIRGAGLAMGAPQVLLGGRSVASARFFDVTHDGQRILLGVPQENASTPLTLVLNWAAVLKK